MQTVVGKPASPGIAIGPSFVFAGQELVPPRFTVSETELEFARLEQALAKAVAEVEALRRVADERVGAEEAAIFDAHALIIQDPVLLKDIRRVIEVQHVNAEAAWADTIEANAAKLDALGSEYLRARAADIRDVGRRILRILLGVDVQDLSEMAAPGIVVARDLTPSDTVNLTRSLVLGFCTAEGGPTSHTAILAKALGLPAVVGAGQPVLVLPSGTRLIVDGSQGIVVMDPTEAALEDSRVRREEMLYRSERERSDALEPAVTRDGHRVEIAANVGQVDEAARALEYGAEGIGLLRTEFLYLGRKSPPCEDEQLGAFNAILEIMNERPVVVRTLDIGGDKPPSYLDLGKENNPFLGWRAIRFCLDQPEFFKIQLRALVQSSPGHDLRIMFPMIATLEEVRRAKALVVQAREEIQAAGHSAAARIQIGIMIEVPSAAILADRLAREVDFFSVGTNDLTQYTLAAERTNERVSHLGDACHPAVLRQIRFVIEEGHRAGIWVGVCGELAGDPDAIPILLGLGLDEFSMAPPSIPSAKALIRSYRFSDAQVLARQVLDLDTAIQVRERSRSFRCVADRNLGECREAKNA